jgi:putative flippase GtrA
VRCLRDRFDAGESRGSRRSYSGSRRSRRWRFRCFAGAAAGFAVKYVLDKNWIFYDDYTTHRDEVRKVTLYGLFSVVTTLVFWGFEVSFWAIWRSDLAKYAGAVIGLAIGYGIKFALDRRFVFRGRSA